LLVTTDDVPAQGPTSEKVGIWSDSVNGIGVWGTTSTGIAIRGSALSGGKAGKFIGDVEILGKLTSNMNAWQVINQPGPLPITSTFTTKGGTLLLFFSGSGFGNASGPIGMQISIDGSPIDTTGIYANQSNFHLAFVSKQWVLTGINAGPHAITLTKRDKNTVTDLYDYFQVTVMEMPY